MSLWVWVVLAVVGWSLLSLAFAVVAGGSVDLAERMESDLIDDHRSPDAPRIPAVV